MRVAVILTLFAMILALPACKRSSSAPPASPTRTNAAPVRPPPPAPPAPPPVLSPYMQLVEDTGNHKGSPEELRGKITRLLEIYPSGKWEDDGWAGTVLGNVARNHPEHAEPILAKMVAIYGDTSKYSGVRGQAGTTIRMHLGDGSVHIEKLLPALRVTARDAVAYLREDARYILSQLAATNKAAAAELDLLAGEDDGGDKPSAAVRAARAGVKDGTMRLADAVAVLAGILRDPSGKAFLLAIGAAAESCEQEPGLWMEHAGTLLALIDHWDSLPAPSRQSALQLLVMLSSTEAASARKAADAFLARIQKKPESRIEDCAGELAAIGGSLNGLAGVKEAVNARLQSKDDSLRCQAVLLVRRIGEIVPNVAAAFLPELDRMAKSDPAEEVVQQADRAARALRGKDPGR